MAALAPLARDHELIITHGNGPQVGLLAMESARDPGLSRPYPLDVLGAQTQGMIGYWLVQALQNALPARLAGCLACRTLVSADDPAFANPVKFVGPVYDEASARQLAAEYDWQVRQDGSAWRRVVPSPDPVRLAGGSIDTADLCGHRTSQRWPARVIRLRNRSAQPAVHAAQVRASRGNGC